MSRKSVEDIRHDEVTSLITQTNVLLQALRYELASQSQILTEQGKKADGVKVSAEDLKLVIDCFNPVGKPADVLDAVARLADRLNEVGL